MIHLLAEANPQTNTVRLCCGLTRTKTVAGPMPDDVTAWGSTVTCPECLGNPPPSL